MVESAKRSFWGWLKSLGRPVAGDEAPPAPYRVFRREFDVEVLADELDTVLGTMPREIRQEHDLICGKLDTDLDGWRSPLLETAAATATRARAKHAQADRYDTIVSMLVDQSGSMRNQKMLFAAASLEIAQDLLLSLGVKVEVLGFTTVKWRGGEARQRWLSAGQPKNPGRLNDLLHVVYRNGDAPMGTSDAHAFRAMLRPDLLKENVDGEAIEWALSRLRRHPENRKLLIVLSDGAPVDDATLAANRLDYLDLHLRQVLAEAEASGDVRIAAVGIGSEYDVGRYYSTSVSVDDPVDLGEALIGLLERTLAAPIVADPVSG